MNPVCWDGFRAPRLLSLDPANWIRLLELIQRADQTGEQDADIVIVLVQV